MGIKRKLSIRIESNGKITLEVENAVGKECLDWTNKLESSLSKDSTAQQSFKPSYYEGSQNIESDLTWKSED